MDVTIIPSYEDEAKSVLAQWRRRALTITLVVTLIAGIPSLVTGTIGGLEAGGLSLFIGWAVYSVLLVTTIFSKISHQIRVWIFLVAGLSTAAINMWFSGLTGTGGIFLIILPVFAFILTDEWAGWVTMSLSLITFAVFSLLAGVGNINWPVVADPNSLYRWISAGAVGTMLMVIAVVLLHNYNRLQVNTLKAEREASAGLRQSYDVTLEGWAKALELRDHETVGHCRRVTELTMQVARGIGENEDLVNIYRGALLHDIGKMGIPDNILLKPGRLNDEEWQIVRQHPIYAYEMLSPIAFLSQSLDIPHYHHERWDGRGYPKGLKEEQIPLAARIFSVVDVWDALISDRPYHKALLPVEALNYIHEHAGTEFDPQIVKVFESIIKERPIPVQQELPN